MESASLLLKTKQLRKHISDDFLRNNCKISAKIGPIPGKIEKIKISENCTSE